jgi:hypothetical protein
MMTKVATRTGTKIAIAIAVVSVAGIALAGVWKIGKTEATLKIKSPVANSTILASDKLKITWDTNVPSGKGSVDVYLTKDSVTAPYDAQYNEITTLENPATHVLGRIKGIDANKKAVPKSNSSSKTGADVLENYPFAIVPGKDVTYKIWIVLKKQPLTDSTSVVTKEATFNVVYGDISFTGKVSDNNEKSWKDSIPFALKYNFPEEGKLSVYLKKNGDATDTHYPLANTTRYEKTTTVGAGDYSGNIFLEGASQVPAGTYALTASWISNDTKKALATGTGSSYNVSAPITVSISQSGWAGGNVKCGATKTSPVSLAKFVVKNENNVDYGLFKLTAEVANVGGTVMGLGIKNIYLADENGVKIANAKPDLLLIETKQILTFDLVGSKIGAKTTKRFQIMGQPTVFSKIIGSVNIKIVEFIAGKVAGNKPAILPDSSIITPTIDMQDAQKQNYKQCFPDNSVGKLPATDTTTTTTTTTISVVNSTTTTPSLKFSASPATIHSGESATLSWSTTNAISCVVPPGKTNWLGASNATSGSQVVGPFSGSGNRLYYLECKNSAGVSTRIQTAKVSVTR